MIKIMHISARADIGGGPEHIAQLITGLRFTCQQFVACPVDRPYYDRFCDLLGSANVIDIPHRRFEISALRSLARFVTRNKIDIVHSHGKGAGVYGRLLTMLCDARSVHTFHGVHTGHYGKFMSIAYAGYERACALRTARGIAVSDGEREQIRLGHLFPMARIEMIPNGVTLGDSLKNQNNFSDKKLRLVAVNRFDYQKNAEGLVEIAEALFRHYPKLEWELRIYGEGVSRMATIARVAEIGLDQNVLMPGNVDSMRPILKRSDIFLSASRWEGLPIAVLEAMSEGMPVVLSDVVGNRDLVDEDITGYLYQLDHASQAADIVFRLSDSVLRRRLGEAAKKMIQSHYSISTMAEKTFEIYQEVHDEPRDET